MADTKFAFVSKQSSEVKLALLFFKIDYQPQGR